MKLFTPALFKIKSNFAEKNNTIFILCCILGFFVFIELFKNSCHEALVKSECANVQKIHVYRSELIRGPSDRYNAKKYDSNAEIKGVLIVEMVKGGKEMIIGSKLEPGMGPVVMLGMGGIYVEILKDVTFRLAPLTDQEANDMISSIKTKKLLDGVRGEEPSDINKLSECIQRLSQLVSDFKEIKELDMNPVLVMEKGQGCKILDVRIGV